MDRRAFLAAAATLGAGCAGGLPVGDGSTPTPADTATPSPTPTKTPSPTPTTTPRPFGPAARPGFTPASNPYADYARSGGLELAAGEYAAFRFGRESPIALAYAFEVIEGGTIDAYLMPAAAFDKYEAEADAFGYFEAPSVENDVDATVSARLAAGEYAIVFDNTYRGTASPTGAVRLRFGLTAAPASTPTPVPTPQFRAAANARFDPEDNPFAGYRRSGGIALDGGEYWAIQFETDEARPFRYGFEVIEGGAVDAFVMSGAAFDTYRNEGDRIGYYAEPTALASEGATAEFRMPAGRNAVVFDNTYLAKAAPSGPVRIVFGIEFGAPA